ncbi:hypothetical protein GOC95_00680 [Methylophilus sp. YYY-1]|nr:hypothetical protein [Methylophilus sp. YYY-1]
MNHLQGLSFQYIKKLKGVLIFFCLFIVMQQIWLSVADTGVGVWWINEVITRTLASTIGWLADEQVTVAGSLLTGAHASMNIANGCDGVDMMLMLIAALLSSTLSLRQKLLGALYGLLFLFLINQLRLLLLFEVLQHDRQHFTFTHGILAPFLMLGATGIFYAWWLAASTQPLADDESTCALQ